jgi:hypothetical protein
MTDTTTTCPHCGKTVSNPDKLGTHLMRECPALVAITNPKSTGTNPAVPSDSR